MVLANTYHLLLRPGVQRIERLGGIHRLMGWHGPILTDSGGYQVFSLAARRSFDEDGVMFQSHIDGSPHRLTPESVVDAQASFGVDVAMVLDECLPFPAIGAVDESVTRSVDWAKAGCSARSGCRRSPVNGLVGCLLSNRVLSTWASGAGAAMIWPMATSMVLPSGDWLSVSRAESCTRRSDCGADAARRTAAISDGSWLSGRFVARSGLWSRPLRLCFTDSVRAYGQGLHVEGRVGHQERPVGRRPSRWTRTAIARPAPVYSRAALRHFFVAKEATSVVLLTIHNLTFFSP